MTKKNCMVAQSGGPTVAINATLAGVLNGVLQSDRYEICYGAIHGVQGILKEDYINLNEMIPDKATMEKLKLTPAMYLGSCRYKLPAPSVDERPYQFIFAQFKQLNIGAFFYIGGNDSMDTVAKLADYAEKIGSKVRIIGVPKTIDNDLVITDHTPGYGSAAKYVAATMLEIAHDTYIYDLKSVTIVEIMGRDAGWLTAAAALARNEYNSAPHFIYLPEVAFDKEKFIADVKAMLKTRNSIIIAVSEGIRDAEGNYITAGEAKADQFGHVQLSGAGKALEYLVKEEIGVKVRSVEISVLQRSASHMASYTDIRESFNQGQAAVQLAQNGMTAEMVTIERLSDVPYVIKFGHTDVRAVANAAKSIPREWINEAGNDVTPALIRYMMPLIQGEVSHTYAGGIPSYLGVEHLKPKNWQ